MNEDTYYEKRIEVELMKANALMKIANAIEDLSNSTKGNGW